MIRDVRGATVGLLALAALALAAPASAEPVKVRVESGVLVGEGAGTVVSFKDIPYAAPPVGPLRWAPPRRAAPWHGERAASAYGPACPQPINANGAPNEGGASGATSEDCLVLNLWAPRGAAKAPVMVWVHGGSNTMGAGSVTAYDGSAFGRDGVILISINYRLGALGFFAHPALTKAAAPGEAVANYGLMDQIAALQWVKRNAAAFGGDPANVTLFGESAGGVDTLALMTSPPARGLFAKAIVESGGGWFPPVSLAKALAEGEAAAVKAGAPAGATVEQLRALPAAVLVGGASGDLVVDGALLPRSTAQAFAAGDIAHVPLIIGSNGDEASLMNSLKLPAAAVLAITPAAVKAAYADVTTDDARARAIFSDAFMGGPARWIAAKAAGGPSWLYHFSYVLDVQRPGGEGAGHASEIPYVFDSWDKLGVLGMGLKQTDHDLAVTRLVHSCWVAFAKTSRPTCAGGPRWPAYTAKDDVLMRFDATPIVEHNFRKSALDVQQAAALPKLGLGD